MSRSARNLAVVALLGFVALLGSFLLLPGTTEVSSTLEGSGPAQSPREAAPGTAFVESGRTAGESAAEPIAAVAFHEAPSFVPVHGDLIHRGGGEARFELLDAAGQPLDWGWCPDPRVALWREVGGCRSRDHAEIEPGRDAVVCRGIGGGGLEPGRYLLELSAGSYGIARHEFLIGRGQQVAGHLRLPHERRVVSLRFIDPRGRPIPYLDDVPMFAPSPSAPLLEQGAEPPDVLLDPPGPQEIVIGCGSAGGSFRASRRSPTLYETDGGYFAVPVIAGAEGRIVFRNGLRLFAGAPREIAGTFTGPEWDGWTVVLEPGADYEARVSGRRPVNADTPGRTSVAASWRTSRFHEPSPPSAACWSGQIRVELALKAPELARSRIFQVEGDKAPIMHFGPHRCVTPVDFEPVGATTMIARLVPERAYLLVTSDGAFLRDDATWLPAGLRHEIGSEGDLHPVSFAIRAPPTLAAFARKVTTGLWPKVWDPALRWHERSRPATRSGPTEFEIRTFVGPRQRQWLKGSTSVHVVCSGRDDGELGFDAGVPRAPSDGWHFAWDIDQDLRRALASGRLELDLARSAPGAPGLVLRAVGPGGEGLPWVEASLIPACDDALAQEMRELSRQLAQRGVRREIERGWRARVIPTRGEPDVITEPAGDAAMAELMGPATTEVFRTSEMRRRLYDLGAWYDTRHQGKTDSYGYLLLRSRHLEPGRTLVLYLWSESRNDLEPDARIVFEATGGVTDLGVVHLDPP